MKTKLIRLAAALILFPWCAWAGGPELTTLRQVGKVEGLWGKGGVVAALGGAKVTVRNAGRVPAQNITVEVRLSTGQTLSLGGPSTLAPNESATYAKQQYIETTGNATLSAEISCSNCR